MQLTVPAVASGVALVAAGVIAATQPLPDVAMPTVQLTSGEGTADTLAELLNTASANYTDAYNVAQSMFTDGVVPTGSTADFGLAAAQEETLAQSMTEIITDLSRDQAGIDAQAGSLSGLVDQFWFAPLDQQEVTLSETMLTDIQALEAAEQSVNAVNWQASLMSWETGFLFDVANLLNLAG